MLDLKALKKNKEACMERFAARGIIFEWDLFEKYDREYHTQSQLLQSYQSQRNALSCEIGKFKAHGLDASELQKSVTDLKEKMEQAEIDFSQAEIQWSEFCQSLPNLIDPRVPIGCGEEDNIVLKKVLVPIRTSGADHTQILEGSGLLMMESASILSGARFNVLKGSLAKIHRALIQFMMDYHEKHGQYEEYYVPYAVQRSALFGTGQLPKFEEDLFAIKGDRDLFLIPTAEVPLTNLFANTIHSTADMPKRLMAHTPCFRSEAGSYGRDMKGIFRQHQFEKIELVHIITAEQSDNEFEFLVQHVSNMLLSMEIPHQLTLLCSKDTGFCSSRTIDIEVWLPGQKKYREISSCSQFSDFQARRMKARHRENAKAPIRLLHTINGSGVAVGRALIALIENHGTEKGCAIPKALQPFLAGKDFVRWE